MLSCLLGALGCILDGLATVLLRSRVALADLIWCEVCDSLAILLVCIRQWCVKWCDNFARMTLSSGFGPQDLLWQL